MGHYLVIEVAVKKAGMIVLGAIYCAANFIN